MLCRWGYMLMADPEPRCARRAACCGPAGASRSPPGRGPEDNPWSGAADRASGRARADAEPPDPGAPGAVRLGAGGRRSPSSSRRAGFTEHRRRAARLRDRVRLVRRLVGHARRLSQPLAARCAARPTRTRRGRVRAGARAARRERFTADGRRDRHARPHLGRVGERLSRCGRVPRPMFYDDDADLTLLDGKTVAIIGYGSQGHAHALNLKDSGVDVVVGLRPDSRSVEPGARRRAWRSPTSPRPPRRGDIVMVLLPDEKHGEIYREQIADGDRAGQRCCCSATASRSTTARSSRRPRSTSRSSPRRARATSCAGSSWRAAACRG